MPNKPIQDIISDAGQLLTDAAQAAGKMVDENERMWQVIAGECGFALCGDCRFLIDVKLRSKHAAYNDYDCAGSVECCPRVQEARK